MGKYMLFSKYRMEVVKGIVISPSAKENFKNMMHWTEKQWKEKTLWIAELQ